MTRPREAAAGTRPAGVPEAERARHVRRMFDAIAPTYDRANHVLSLGVDHYWRWRTVRELRHALASRPPDTRARVLDVCCGTGDLTLALARSLDNAEIVGLDFAHAMVARARAKSAGLSGTRGGPGVPGERSSLGWGVALGPVPIQCLQGDALRLPFSDGCFAAVTSAFGFRNLSDYRAGLAEFHRLLEPGGLLAILEITEPSAPVLGTMYRIYFERVLPRLGGWISGHPEAYRYLPDSVSRFPSPPVLAQWMLDAGFTDFRCLRFATGIATLHLARKNPVAILNQ